MKRAILKFLVLGFVIFCGSFHLSADELIFKDTPILDVLEIISQETGCSIFLDKNIDPGTLKVNMFARKLDILDVFHTVIQSQGLKLIEMSPKSFMIFPKDKIDDYMNEKYQKVFYLSNADPKELRNTIKGINPQMKVYIDEKINGLIVFDTEENLKMVGALIDSIDKVKPQVMIDLKILEVSSSKLDELGIEFNKVLRVFPTHLDGSNITRTDNENNMLRLGRLDKTDIGALLNILLSDTSTTILASPRIKVAYGKKANINVGRKVPIVQTIIQRDSGGSTTEPKVEYENVGVKFEVEVAQIDNDARVSLDIKSEVSNIVRYWSGPNGSQYPETASKVTETSIRLNDNEQIIMGGLVENKQQDSLYKTPFVSDLPLIGNLFNKKKRDYEKTEIIMFLTPQIIYPKVDGVNDERGMVEARIGNELESTFQELERMDLEGRNEIEELKAISHGRKGSTSQTQDEDLPDDVDAINRQFKNIQPVEELSAEEGKDARGSRAKIVKAGSISDFINNSRNVTRMTDQDIKDRIEQEKKSVQQADDEESLQKDRVIKALMEARKIREESQEKMLDDARQKASVAVTATSPVINDSDEMYRKKYEEEKLKRVEAENQLRLANENAASVELKQANRSENMNAALLRLQERIKNRQEKALSELPARRDTTPSEMIPPDAGTTRETIRKADVTLPPGETFQQKVTGPVAAEDDQKGWTKKIVQISDTRKKTVRKTLDQPPVWKSQPLPEPQNAVPETGESLASRMQKAEKLRMDGKYELALKAYEDLMMEYPRNASILYNIGSILVKLGETRKAEKVFSLALEMDPESPYAKHARRLLKMDGVY